MRLCRLRVSDFAGIARADIELGPGLNVLYGPNDLGKSTLADAIRLALLLPHGSSHAEQYVPWTGGQRPEVELTFETEPQRIWRVRKQFGRSGGLSLLQESRDGVDFSDVEKARRVDGRIRELLRWGIPEPGGSGGAKGLPDSFLATVLLSTQADVAAVLRQSLEEDPTGSGKERIAAALQAVAQDPLFIELLRATQARRDEAYTEKGSKKSSKDSPFRRAAERVRQLRDEKERWQQAVDDSEGVERQLRDLAGRRTRLEERVSAAAESLSTIERLARETEDLRVAGEQVRLAEQQVARIRQLELDIADAQRSVEQLAEARTAADAQLVQAQELAAHAESALDSARRALEALSGEGPGGDTVERQALVIRQNAVQRDRDDAERRLQGAAAAVRTVEEAQAAEAEHQRIGRELASVEAVLADASEKEQSAHQEVERLTLLESALAVREATVQLDAAAAAVQKDRAARDRAEALEAECQALEGRRAAVNLPGPDVVAAMRRLETELAAARGALNVGVVVTVAPVRPLDARVRRDGSAPEAIAIEQPTDFEAGTDLEIEIADVAAVRVRGGRREAQETARRLEERWSAEAVPHLAAARAESLAALDVLMAQGREIESATAAKRAEAASLRGQLADPAIVTDAHREAAERLRSCRAALGKTALEPLLEELGALGSDPAGTLRKKKARAAKTLDGARVKASEARTLRGVVEERLRNAGTVLDTAITARDAVLQEFPDGPTEAHAAAQAALAAAKEESEKVALELQTFDARFAEARRKAETTFADVQRRADEARSAAEAARQAVTDAITAHSVQVGRLDELRRARAAEDLPAAEEALREATGRRGALPVPERPVVPEEIAPTREALDRLKSELENVDRDVQRAHGALAQVGGGVARERLRDVSEACELAERQEREVESDCEAWRLLLDQMKEADAEQASNLGQVLGPAVAARFEALTNRRYHGVRIGAALDTEGVLVGGSVRSTERISVGTREQLSTLYRLSLAEYLGSTVVLDDQLVQSDNVRMDWFRALLRDKARSFQIVVLTCREDDYLSEAAMPRGVCSMDSEGGLVRAVNLERVIRRL
jgi:uncharacterized protein YhaN